MPLTGEAPATLEELNLTDEQEKFGREAVFVDAGVAVKNDDDEVIGYLIDGRVIGKDEIVYLGLDDPETSSDEPGGDETVFALASVPSSYNYRSA